jgi:hypothetical protein
MHLRLETIVGDVGYICWPTRTDDLAFVVLGRGVFIDVNLKLLVETVIERLFVDFNVSLYIHIDVIFR